MAKTRYLAGSLAATGDTSATPFEVNPNQPLNLNLTGTWVGTVALKRKLPNDSAYRALTVNGSTWGSYTANVSEQVWEETETGTLFILDFTRTSGTVDYRLSQ